VTLTLTVITDAELRRENWTVAVLIRPGDKEVHTCSPSVDGCSVVLRLARRGTVIDVDHPRRTFLRQVNGEGLADSVVLEMVEVAEGPWMEIGSVPDIVESWQSAS